MRLACSTQFLIIQGIACCGTPARHPAPDPYVLDTRAGHRRVRTHHDLRERIWSFYQVDLQELTRQQRQPEPVDPIEINEDDPPF